MNKVYNTQEDITRGFKELLLVVVTVQSRR